MIDPGRPFAVPFHELVTRLERAIVHGVAPTHSFMFEKNVRSYALPYDIESITRASGFIGSKYGPFEDKQFRIAEHRFTWVDTKQFPDERKLITIEYGKPERPPGITDFNEGSVIGTLLRATARELAQLYAQMDEAYRRAFIDIAEGFALDNVVALLGVTRTEAQPARGDVRFFRKTAPTSVVDIPVGTRVADKAGRVFVTQQPGQISATSPNDVRVPVFALVPGSDGNVAADTISVMPTPPPGVDGVTNTHALTEGQEPESDERLRDRAKHELERAGKATLDAIRFAVLSVDGVDGATVIDHSLDEAVPLGEVRVRHSGGERSQVSAAVEATRAAGVLVRLETIGEVRVSGTFYLAPAVPSGGAAATDSYKSKVIATMSALAIGQALNTKRLAAHAFEVPGLAELAEAQLEFTGPHPGTSYPGEDVVKVAATEVIRPDPDHLTVTLLAALQIVDWKLHDNGDLEISLAVLESSPGTPSVTFRSFGLDLNVAVGAVLLPTSSYPPERIANLSKRASFVASNQASIVLASDELAGFRAADHGPDVELSITSGVLPGLAGVVKRVPYNRPEP